MEGWTELLYWVKRSANTQNKEEEKTHAREWNIVREEVAVLVRDDDDQETKATINLSCHHKKLSVAVYNCNVLH